ncbi:MAG: YeeE/YedE thiosulfate transporter family protein [Methanoregula sp.]|nr:MAG: YeeE/YedE thiosulfate transporter family protein [Methanoregula sp.]
MLSYFTQVTWSPYITGAAIGVLVCISFLLSDRRLGCSTGYVKISGLIALLFQPDMVEKNEYYRTIPPALDWKLAVVPGIVIGAFISAMLSGSFEMVWVPALWGDTFGSNPVVRVLVAVIGGIFLEIGARWAGGCTSGHGISGTSQLSCAGITAASCFFISGILTAMLLFRVIGA